MSGGASFVSQEEQQANELLKSRSKTGCFFNDGERKIDYVLVWEDPLRDNASKQSAERKLENAVYRRKFRSSLLLAGLQLEEETAVTETKTFHFWKLNVTWEAMCYWAENLKMRAPIKPVVNPPTASCLQLLFPQRQQLPNQPVEFYTCAFAASRVQRFFGIEHGDAFFTSSQRSMVAREILCTQVYGEEQHFEIGIDRMIDADIFASAFPLHEGPCETSLQVGVPTQNDPESPSAAPAQQHYVPPNPRMILRTYWASRLKWFSYQPLDHVQEYFGEKIAFYFAWLGVYTQWLIPAAVVGLAVFLYGCVTMNQDVPSNEACRSGSRLKMCPVCDDRAVCPVWELSEVCWRIRLANMLDHQGAIFYSVFASLWAVMLVEHWRRRNTALQQRWGVADYCPESAPLLSGFALKCNEFRPHPVTGAMEPHYSAVRRIPRFIFSAFCILIMVSFVGAFLLLVILCQTALSALLFRTRKSRPTAKITANCAASAVQLLIMIFMEKVFQKMAHKLTKWEFHRTQQEFDDHLAMKMFVFEVTNYYAWIFYIAFFKGSFPGYPGNYQTVIGFRQEQCDEGGCLFDLGISLAIIMTGRTLISAIGDACVPMLRTMSYRKRVGLDPSSAKPWEADYCLTPQRSLLPQYRKMTLQFGFIALFVAAFPLAPLVALAKNSLAIRQEAKRLVVDTRRPMAERAQGIGVWLRLLEILAAASVISNAFLIAFTSEFLPRLLYTYELGTSGLRGFTEFSLAWAPPNTTSQPCRYRDYRDATGKNSDFYWKLLVVQLSFVLAFVHVVFLIRHLAISLTAGLPSALRLKIEREKFLDRQELADIDPLPQRKLWAQLQQQPQQQPQQPQQPQRLSQQPQQLSPRQSYKD